MKNKVAKKKSVPQKTKKAQSVKTPAKLKPKPKAKVKEKVKTKAKATAKPKAKATVKAVPIRRIVQKEESLGPYQEIKKMLERQKQALLAEAGATLESTLNAANEGFPDWTDQASVEVDQNSVLRLREREQHLLNKIEDAIERIDGDTFGVCDVCSTPISLKRLKARPVTTLCIECKTKQEFEEKMRQ